MSIIIKVEEKALTKTQFVTGTECARHLWLQVHKPELRTKEKSDRSAKEGMEVGLAAEHLFEDVTRIPYDLNKLHMIATTEEAIAAGASVVAEAAFMHDGLYCQVDYLEIEADGVIINEVKAVTKVRKQRTKNKQKYDAELLPKYLHDCAFQYHVLTACGYHVKRVNCICLNDKYSRHGALDYRELFQICDVTEEVVARCEQSEGGFANDLNNMEKMLMSDEDPGDTIVRRCDDCEMWPFCAANLPTPSVWDLNGKYAKKRKKWYEEGLRSFEDLIAADVLDEISRLQVEAELRGTEYQDIPKIREFLGNLSYPLFFLDFETYMSAIPEFEDQKPYEQMAFQYSLDVIWQPGGKIEHMEFLGDELADNRRTIAERLVQEIPADACVTAYNKSFEAGRIERMAELFPDLANHLLAIVDHLEDFWIPFDKCYYYVREMGGSTSIKKVLPALFPDDENLDYKRLPGVQRGDEAMDMFLHLRDLEPAERAKQRAYMLRYCGLDTFAMIKVYEGLLRTVDDTLYGSVAKATTEFMKKRKAAYAAEDAKLEEA